MIATARTTTITITVIAPPSGPAGLLFMGLLGAVPGGSDVVLVFVFIVVLVLVVGFVLVVAFVLVVLGDPIGMLQSVPLNPRLQVQNPLPAIPDAQVP